jgi:hypothetical protein
MRLVCKFHQQHDSIILVLLKRTYGIVFQVFLYNVVRLYGHPFPP